ncbi:hypothetical protein Ancab_036877 [Ancistrocladus abbreviatus]
MRVRAHLDPRWDCNYSSVFTSKDQSETSRPNGVELVESNREELLRNLDELKDQLSRSCDVKEKTVERIPLDQRAVHPEPYADSDEWLHNLSSGFSRGSRQFYAPNKRAIRPHYFDHHHEPISVMNRSEMTMHNYHPSMPNSNLNLRCEDPVGHHTLRRPPYRMAAKHRHQTSHPYLSSSSHYIGGEPDPFEPHPYEKLVCVSTPTKQTSPGALDRSNEVGLNSSKSDELQNVCSLSPGTSEDVECPDDFVPRHGVNNAPEMPVRNAFSPPPPGSPLEDVDRCGKGNLSSRSDQERVITNKSSLRQNSLKESLLTEMEMSPSDYANTGATQDTADASREEDQLRGKRFLAGLIKKRFWDFSRSMQAEKLAGPIYPGQYWYDFRAGFWGAMGGPCLGIIPPFIEEFNYPMLENCAAGDTGVFVNGRELHQKDLDLLASRGLPVTREGSYLIDISGRVLDEDSGEELDSLGKLAPTVEKVKHGFGMTAPKAAK